MDKINSEVSEAAQKAGIEDFTLPEQPAWESATVDVLKAMFEILKKEKPIISNSDMMYPEESDGFIDARFIPSLDLSMGEDMYRPVFIPNAASFAQGEVTQDKLDGKEKLIYNKQNMSQDGRVLM